MVDFFCGAGIGAVGFKLAGYDIVDAFDNKDYAVSTYNRNIGNHARVADIRNLHGDNVPNADVYVGGFPCKPFSFAGKGEGVSDKNNGDLGYHFYRLVNEKRPKAIIIENVKGIISKTHREFFDELLDKFTGAGYSVNWKLVNCHEYGIAQIRERVFIVGIRNDLGLTFEFPESVEDSERKVLRDVIDNLPDPNGLNNHKGYGIRKDEAPFIDKIPPGGNWRNLNEDDARAFMKGSYDLGGGRTGYIRKMLFDKPALTITSNMNGKFNAQIIDNRDKYRDENVESAPRRFTVRECLRIQSVPDWFSFSDDIPLAKQYERCSGIPSLVAYKLGVALANQLNACSHVGKRWESDNEDETGSYSLYTCDDCGEEMTEYHEVR